MLSAYPQHVHLKSHTHTMRPLSISEMSTELHWLPVKRWIEYQVGATTCKLAGSTMQNFVKRFAHSLNSNDALNICHSQISILYL